MFTYWLVGKGIVLADMLINNTQHTDNKIIPGYLIFSILMQ